MPEAWAALKTSSLVKDDEHFTDGRLSLVGFRALMTSLCMVFILARRQRGCTMICTCSTFTKLGTCCHELITRYLHGDKAIIMAPLSSMTHKNAVDLQAADEDFRQKKRAGRPAALPQQNALKTVNFKLLRVEQRQKKKKQAKDDAQEAQWKLFREGISPDPCKLLEGQDRMAGCWFGEALKNQSQDVYFYFQT